MWDKKRPRSCHRGSGRAPSIGLLGVYHLLRELLDQGFPYLLIVAVVGRTDILPRLPAADLRLSAAWPRRFSSSRPTLVRVAHKLVAPLWQSFLLWLFSMHLVA